MPVGLVWYDPKTDAITTTWVYSDGYFASQDYWVFIGIL